MSEMKIDFNPVRLCEAISRIGYEPHSAIMDIVDNSVTANSDEVKITLILQNGKTLKQRNSVSNYQIVDNGHGMTIDEIKSAFSLGANGNYGPKSLSKYGMGLKSAGLSLGQCISIVSKKNGNLSNKISFDKDYIEKENAFVLKQDVLNSAEKKYYEELIKSSHGTVIEITGCERVNHASPKATIEKLTQRLGVVYYSFMKREERPLKVFTRVCALNQDDDYIEVIPKDILHTDSNYFRVNYQPDNYDCTCAYLALDDYFDVRGFDNEELGKIRIQGVVFPQAKLTQKRSPLSEQQKIIIKSYEVSRENMGFFVYRNGRLIRWGDDIGNLVGKDEINIRFRMDLETEHDDILHVDVTKQRLEIDDEHRRRLEQIISRAIETAKQVREYCQTIMKSGSDDEGAGFNSTVINVPEDDPDESIGREPSSEVISRKRASAEEAKTVEDASEDDKPSQEGANSTEGNTSEFRKIRYTENIPYARLWKAYSDAKEGVFVCISKKHPFYNEIITKFPENSIERLSIEALIFSVSVAEMNTTHNFDIIEKSVIDTLYVKFHKNIANWLADWSYENVSLSSDD